MRTILCRFLVDRRGATAIEYGLIVGVLSLTIVAGFNTFTNAFTEMMNGFSNVIDESYQ